MADFENGTKDDAQVRVSGSGTRAHSGWVRVPANSRVQIEPDVPHPWVVEARTDDGKSDRQHIPKPTSRIVLSDKGGKLKIKASPPGSR
jgi:hypothetical protein